VSTQLVPVTVAVAAEANARGDDEKANAIASRFIASAVAVDVATDAPRSKDVAQDVANVTPADVAVAAAPPLALDAAENFVDVVVNVVAESTAVASEHADVGPGAAEPVTVAVFTPTPHAFKLVVSVETNTRSTFLQKLHAYSHEIPSSGASIGC
jgi:hypothetical protein